jgi:peptidoglycan/LPS O-acetylase OafA/YrhL
LRRTIPILRGLAILDVILAHANWHVLARFTAGDVRGYPFVVLDEMSKCAVAAFMFIAGYFIAYVTSGGKRDLPWQVIRARLENLLWPWLVWSAVFVVGHSFQDRPIALVEFLRALIMHYYFVPLLICYYLLARVLARWAKTHTRVLLIGAAIVQLLAVALFYARAYHPGFPEALKPWVDHGPLQYLRFALYFPFGIVCGMFPRRVEETLARFRPVLPWLALLAFGLSVAENSMAYNTGGAFWPLRGLRTKLSSALFCVTFILCFVAFEGLKVPFSRMVSQLGARSYGLYLCHYPVLGIVARVVRGTLPWVASQGWLFLPLLLVSTTSLTVLLMMSVAKLPAKRIYRYLFG